MKWLYSLLFVSVFAFSHDGAEVPSGRFAAKYGGRVAFVADDDHKLYLAEIIISDSDKVRLYIYDLEMKQVDLKDFPSQIVGDVKNKNRSNQKVSLSKKDKYFVGELRSIKNKPYHLNFEFEVKGENLHVEFPFMD